MTIFYAYKNRGITKDITMQNGAGATITAGENDKIRAVIGREGKLGAEDGSTFLYANAEFSVTSDAATSNGSSFTKNSPSGGVNRLRLDASDLDFAAGTYTLFLDLYDNADSQDWKNISRQTFILEST